MAYQSTFKRYELKYLLTLEQKELLMQVISQHLIPDKYGNTHIRNIYYDTDRFRLIRTSIEKPVFKEKLRIRSYRQLRGNEAAFVELKKKYNGIVYKRRISMPHLDAMQWLAGNSTLQPSGQIASEIQYFSSFYQSLHPVVFLSYERNAWHSAGNELRVTFDHNIQFRQDRLDLAQAAGGLPLLPHNKELMEIKTSGGIPLWLTHALTENRIFKTSYSKYGNAYQTIIHKGAHQYVK